jgi:hypothetical protein
LWTSHRSSGRSDRLPSPRQSTIRLPQRGKSDCHRPSEGEARSHGLQRFTRALCSGWVPPGSSGSRVCRNDGGHSPLTLHGQPGRNDQLVSGQLRPIEGMAPAVLRDADDVFVGARRQHRPVERDAGQLGPATRRGSRLRTNQPPIPGIAGSDRPDGRTSGVRLPAWLVSSGSWFLRQRSNRDRNRRWGPVAGVARTPLAVAQPRMLHRWLGRPPWRIRRPIRREQSSEGRPPFGSVHGGQTQG